MTARDRIERLRSANPGAAELATLCALAVVVEPELLRRLRLLLPNADVTAESDLWTSDLLSGASPRGIALDPTVADELRTDLRMPRWEPLRGTAWQHVADCHRTLHWSLRLEEQINRHVVDGVGPERIEPLILAAVRELVASGRGQNRSVQVGIARWLLSALARLPRPVADTDAASAAGLAAGLHLDGRVPVTDPGRVGEQWLPWLLGTADAPTTRVPVRFTDVELKVNSTRDDAVAIELPRTDPMILDVDWHDGRAARSARLTFAEGERAACEVTSDEVVLTTLAGNRTRLRRYRTTLAGLDFSAERARHRPCLARSNLRDKAFRAVRQVPWTIFEGDRGTGKTVLACALADHLERSGWVVIQHFYGVEPDWDTPEVVASSLEAQLRAAFPDADWRRVTGQPGGLWSVLQQVHEITSGPEVLVLIDGIPTTSGEDTTHWMFSSSSLPSKAPQGVRFLITGRHADGVTGWLEPEDRCAVFDLNEGADEVCFWMLDYESAGLRAAFGTQPGDYLESTLEPAPRVFISSVYDDLAHVDQLRRLWTLLRNNGIDAVLDLEGPAQRQYSSLRVQREVRDADFILIVASPEYRRRAEADMPADESGVQWEASVIRELVDSDRFAARRKVLPVLLPGRSTADIPLWLLPHATTSYRVDEFTPAGAEELIRVLRQRSSSPPPRSFSLSVDSDLLLLAGWNPGRLAGIIDWLLSKPPGTATIDAIPWSLTVQMPGAWRELVERFSEHAVTVLAAVAVAADGFTVDDLRHVADFRSVDQLMDDAGRRGLLIVDGARVRAEPSLTTALVDEYGPEVLVSGHTLHARALDLRDLGSASPYQISASVRHVMASVDQPGGPDRSALVQLCRSAEFLRRRACQDGVAAVLDDLRAVGGELAPVIHAAERVADVATKRPNRFVELLIAELFRNDAAVGGELADDWLPALIPRWVRRRGAGQPRPRISQSTIAAASAPDQDWFALAGPGRLTVVNRAGKTLFSIPLDAEPSALVCHNGDIAVALGPEVWLVSVKAREAIHHWHATSPVTVLKSFGNTLVAGTRSGVVLMIQRDRDARPVVGHGGPVTALAMLDENGFLSASLDGTVRIWGLPNGAPRQTLHHRAPVHHVIGVLGHVVSADETGRVRWWDAATGHEMRSLRGHDAAVTALHAIDSLTVMSACRDGSLWLWHRTNPELDRRFADTGPAVLGMRHVLFPETETAFLSWDEAGQLTWWDRKGVRLAVRRPEDLRHPIRTVLPHLGDEIQVVHAGGVLTVRIPSRPDRPRKHQEPGGLAVLDHDRVMLGTTNGLVRHDATLNRWESDEGRPRSAVVAVDAVDGGQAIVAWADGPVQLRPRDGRWTSFDDVPWPARLVGLAGDGGVICDRNGDLVVVNRSGHVRPLWAHVPEATALAGGQLGRWFTCVVGDAHGDVTAFVSTGEQISMAAPSPITAIATDSDWCVVGTADGSVFRWRPTPWELIPLGRHDGPVEDVAAVDERFVASTSVDGTVRLWDVRGGVEHAIVAGSEAFHGVAFAKPRQLYARSGPDGLWLFDVGEVMAEDRFSGIVRDSLQALFTIVGDRPIEIRALRLPGRSASAASEVRLSFRTDGRFAEPLDQDGRLAVPRRFPANREVSVRVSTRPVSQITSVEIAYVTPGRRDERWLEITIDTMRMEKA